VEPRIFAVGRLAANFQSGRALKKYENELPSSSSLPSSIAYIQLFGSQLLAAAFVA